MIYADRLVAKAERLAVDAREAAKTAREVEQASAFAQPKGPSRKPNGEPWLKSDLQPPVLRPEWVEVIWHELFAPTL